LLRRAVAEVFEQRIFRMATALPQDLLAVVISARGVLDLGLPQDQSAQHVLKALRTIDH